MTSPDFEFVVEESFVLTGRGVGVFGHWRSGSFRSGDGGYLQSGAAVVPIERINVEYARMSGGVERVALLLHGLALQQVPAGSVVRSAPLVAL